MKHQWLNLFPAVVFFLAFFVGDKDFILATKALMAAVVAQLALLKILRQPIPKAVLITAVLVLVFGSVTLFFRDEIFLQIKTTAINWLFAGALLVADFALGKNLLRALLGGFFQAANTVWRTVSCWTAAFLFALGGGNLLVIHFLSAESWVWIKTFAYPGATFLFLIGIIFYLSRVGKIKEDAQ
ncbi:MAG: septation protein IspZ [Candidatus Zeuxoniibacter abyssi]|nr:MAG: septation protein IspZ [Candidatus Persebacteraceae bacterium AB1(2)]